MSEQFANLASTTLASAYAAGSGSISLVSASGFPTSGTFTLVIRDQATKAIKLLFRVTSVSGTTFTGAAEGTDAAANAGDLVDGTMVSVAMLAQFKADILASVPPAGSPFIQTLTAPVAANFAQLNFNTGLNVVTTQNNNTSPVNSVTLTQKDPNGTLECAALIKSPIAATFTVTLGFTAVATAANACIGLFLYDGANLNIMLCYQASLGFRIPFFNNLAGSFNSDVLGAINTVPFPLGPLCWLRIQETVSARNYYVSSDGINFMLVATESNSAHFTTAKYGFAAQRGTSIITAYSFSETNP